MMDSVRDILQKKIAEFDRVTLIHRPTPMRKLDRLSAELGGPEIWIKRDDLTGLALGGNKSRKLEFIIADALAKKCRRRGHLGGGPIQLGDANGRGGRHGRPSSGSGAVQKI